MIIAPIDVDSISEKIRIDKDLHLSKKLYMQLSSKEHFSISNIFSRFKRNSRNILIRQIITELAKVENIT